METTLKMRACAHQNCTAGGKAYALAFQVAGVSKALGAVSRIIGARWGNLRLRGFVNRKSIGKNKELVEPMILNRKGD